MTERIKSVRDLVVYKKAFDAAMTIFEISKDFPERGKIFFDRSNPSILEVGLHQPFRSLAQAKIQGRLRK